MKRRHFVGLGALGLVLPAMAGPATARLMQGGTDSLMAAARRLAAEMTEAFDPATLDRLQALAAMRGWSADELPPLPRYQDDIAADFRQDRVVTLRRVRLSETEAGWILASREA